MDVVSVEKMITRARIAQRQIEQWSQGQVDDLVAAVGWECYRLEVADYLAEMTMTETGFGESTHLSDLQRYRILGVMRDMHGQRTVGPIDENPRLGTVTHAKPVGVIGVASPATAPASGVICNALAIMKTRNAAIFSPNPRAHKTAMETIRIMRGVLEKVGAPQDLIQCVPVSNRDAANSMMRSVDLVVATGGKGVVKRAFLSGTPALAAGAGNPTVIIDESADLVVAIEQVHHGATYNNGTSCSSESNILAEKTIASQLKVGLEERGVHFCSGYDAKKLENLLWLHGSTLNRDVVGKSADYIAKAAGIVAARPSPITALAIEPDTVNFDSPIWGEKMSPIFTFMRYEDYSEAVEMVERVTGLYGRGHSCGIHTRIPERVSELAARIDASRVVVNQSTITNSGSFGSGVPFTATLSCGTWGGTTTAGNVTWRDFLNRTVISRPIPARVPNERTLFGKHWCGELVPVAAVRTN